jgi:PEP-CTERM motif
MKKSVLGVALCAVFGASSVAHSEVIVDLFTDPAGGQAVTVTNEFANDNNQSGPFPATILGGYRDLSITKTQDVPLDPTMPTPNLGTSTAVAGFGVLDISNDTGNKSKTVVTWDGIGAAGVDGSGVDIDGLNIDLTMGGSTNAFLARVLAADLGFNYKITVWDRDGDKSTLSAGVQFGFEPPVFDDADYLFDWFNLANGAYCDGSQPAVPCDPFTQLSFSIFKTGNIDFTRIGAMQLELENASTISVDFALGSIKTVPEPTTLGLVGLALLGVGAVTRRRSK